MKGAIGLEVDAFRSDLELGCRVCGAMDDQLGIGHKPEGPLARLDACAGEPHAGSAAATGPVAGAGGMQSCFGALLLLQGLAAALLMQQFGTDAAPPGAGAGGQLVEPFVVHPGRADR